LIEAKMPLEKHLLPFAQALLHQIGLLARFTTIKDLTINEYRIIFPLSGAAILLSIVDGKPKLGNFAPVGKRPDFRIARQPADEHHFVEIRHVACLPRGG
jgi:hypothetical protein